ncbi:MAG: 50S ribosomal protein L22 [Patescibacteria group bacterium]
MKQQIAQLNYLKIAPRKVRLIADTLRGLSASEAEAQLLLRVQRSSKPLLKLLRSAMANAKNNQKLSAEKLVISKILVNQGPMLKRSLPRAQGRATPLQKKMSHVTLVLEERERVLPSRFVINPPVKSAKTKPKKEIKPKISEAKSEKPKEKAGFFRRLFRRKSV